MNKQYKEKLNLALNLCMEHFDLWDKKCKSINDILSQIDSLSRANWDVFEMPNHVKEELQEALEIRLAAEVASLGSEIKNLKSLEESFDFHRSSVQSYCYRQLQNPQNLLVFEGLKALCGISSSLHLLIGMERVPVKGITMQDKDSFKLFDDTNVAMKVVRRQFEEHVQIWNEIQGDM